MISVLVEIDTSGVQMFAMTARALAPALQVDPTFPPVPMTSLPSAAAFGMHIEAMRKVQSTAVLRARIEKVEQAVDLLKGQNVVAVWSDPEVAPFIDCQPGVPKGEANDVRAVLNADKVWAAAGMRGSGVTIGIVDGGVDGSIYPVTGGWSPGSPPGNASVAWGGHGNMCAFDSLIAAPDAKLFDYSIGKAAGGTPALLSTALQSFQHALTAFQASGRPQVLSNSWGLYQQSQDPFPPGNPMNYSHNLNHPFMRKVVEVMNAGMLVSFAAGNCGAVCATPQCGSDIGPGRSIRGANGHERVICVGAVNVTDEWIGYSSQGPSTLFPEKPDVCGFSHFKGHFPSDTGTSAACPTVAGVLALLKGAFPGLSQDRAREVLKRTARQRAASQWDDKFGYGVVDAFFAYRALP